MQFKKIISIILCLVVFCFSVLPVSAANRKSSLSEYANKGKLKYTEELLYSFDDTSLISVLSENHTIDQNDKKEGTGSYSAFLNGADRAHIFTIHDFGKSINMQPTSSRRVTLKMWINISSTENIKCDHEELYSYNYSNSSTIFFRAISGKSEQHLRSINQTIWKTGWQEVEFDLSHHNGSDGFDFNDVTGCFLFCFIKGPVTVKVDSLRACYYTNPGYVADTSDIFKDAKIISTCDFDALDGAMVNEWFDADFSTEIKHSGSSSVHGFANCQDDQRLHFADNDIKLDRSRDYLCFWIYIDDASKLQGLFIEANEIQDEHEYELSPSTEEFKYFTKEKNYTKNWFMLQIPIQKMGEYLMDGGPSFITLKSLRICPLAKSGEEVNIYIDSIFITTMDKIAIYNRTSSLDDNSDVSSSDSVLVSGSDTSTSTESTQSTSGSDAQEDNLLLYVAIICGGVLITTIIIIAVVIIIKKRKGDK